MQNHPSSKKYPFYAPDARCGCRWEFNGTWDPEGHLGWPERCSEHNTAMMSWRRSRDWRIAVARARKNAEWGKTVFLITLTSKHQPIQRERWMRSSPWRGGQLWMDWDDRFTADCIAVARSTVMKANAQRLMRSAAWKRHVHGALWALECTVRPVSRCHREEQTRLDVDGNPVVHHVWTSHLGWSIHPHIHIVAVGKRWNMDELRALSLKYGFSANPDIRQVRSLFGSVSYVTKYATKDQPVGRSHNTIGTVRAETARLRKERKQRRVFTEDKSEDEGH